MTAPEKDTVASLLAAIEPESAAGLRVEIDSKGTVDVETLQAASALSSAISLKRIADALTHLEPISTAICLVSNSLTCERNAYGDTLIQAIAVELQQRRAGMRRS